MVRTLKTDYETQFRGRKEFNILRITNIQHFFDSYTNHIDYYKTAFEVLSDLEAQIKYENNPDATILISYKDDGDVIFDLIDIKEVDGYRLVQYEFSTFIS